MCVRSWGFYVEKTGESDFVEKAKSIHTQEQFIANSAQHFGPNRLQFLKRGAKHIYIEQGFIQSQFSNQRKKKQ